MQRFIAAALLALFAFVMPAEAASRLFISEYNGIGITTGVVAQIAVEPSKDQVVDFSGGVTSSAAVSNNASYVRLICDTQCSVQFGTAPTATTSTKLLSAGVPEYFSIPKGQAYKISVIANP
jgi:hypothetical protein